jgi:hypothetical protein
MTPAQGAVRLICGVSHPGLRGYRHLTLAERIRGGRALLVQISGKDFSYDLAAWHAHLKESRQGGYTWARTIMLPRIMKSALASEEWRQAVSELEQEPKARS